jgi:hypothetical protein
MTLQASGAISFDDIRTEYAQSSGPISMGNYYRGGTAVRGNASNNNATNLSANVPTSGAIALDDFYSQKRAWKYTESTNRTNKEASDYFGTDSSVDYPKELVISSTITNNNANGVALNFSSSWDGTTTVTVNGTLRSYSGYCLRNQSSQSITVNGTGSIRKNNKDALVSALQSVNGTLGLSFSVGGFGGASGSKVRHSSVAGNANFYFLLRRSATNTFRFEWTYNECDYANLGGGTENFQTAAASIIPLDSNGNYDDTNTTTYIYNGGTGAAGRDSRDFMAASRVISGQRHFWFGTNNKRSWPTNVDSGATSYSQPGHYSQSLTTSNSKRSSLIQTLTGNHSTGTFSISGPSLTTG